MHSPVKGLPHIRQGNPKNTFGENLRTRADGTLKSHQGWDISSPPGTPVYAITNGVVRFVKNHGDYGKQICLEFNYRGRTLYAFYAHLQTIDVVPGMFIAEGEQVGTSGQTGNAAGQALSEAHLHFEIRTKTNAGSGTHDRLDPSTVLGREPLREIARDLFSGVPALAPIPKW